MRIVPLTLAMACALMFFSPVTYSQIFSEHSHSAEGEGEEREPSAVLTVGGVTSWNVNGGAAIFAPNVALERTVIPHWLEIETSVSPFFTRGFTEIDTDMLFKKPWKTSEKTEFMLGVGPQWVRVRQHGINTSSISGELVGDFMFWPGRRHRFGWYLEPTYDHSFAKDHQQFVGMSAGLLIGIF